MKPDNNSNNGGGMSRAAKKRAKKNKKKNEVKRQAESGDKEILSKKARLEDPEEGEDKTRETPQERTEHDDFEVPFNDDDDGDKDEGESAPILDPTDAYVPKLPNTPLTEVLLFKESRDQDKRKLLENMTASQRASCLFQAIIDPTPLDVFYKEYFEKKPLLVRAKNRKRYDGLLSLEGIRKMSKKTSLYYNRDLNVTRYEKDSEGVKRRATKDKAPSNEKERESGVRVDPKELWSNFDKGCTVRLLCPHKNSDSIHALLSTLELELQCMVGANAYLTPPKASQGFAPHYDDIEAFCLQLEGSKRWKVYEPTLELPRVSSEDYTVDDIKEMKLVMDVTTEPGDLLYMPRGWVHQACTLKDENEHSLHLTVSAMQQWAWVELMDVIIPEALEEAANGEDATLREGLPRGFMDYMGAMYEEPSDEKLPESLKKVTDDEPETKMEIKLRRMLQERFRADAKKRITKVAKTAYEMVDAACDQLAKRFMSDRQPFVLTKTESQLTNRGEPEGEEREIMPNTLCRLVRPGLARLVIEEDKAVVYHCGDNSREYHGNPLSPLEFEMDDGPAIEQLLTTVEPHWIFVNDLYHDTIEDKVAIARALYDEGFLAIKGQEEHQE